MATELICVYPIKSCRDLDKSVKPGKVFLKYMSTFVQSGYDHQLQAIVYREWTKFILMFSKFLRYLIITALSFLPKQAKLKGCYRTTRVVSFILPTLRRFNDDCWCCGKIPLLGIISLHFKQPSSNTLLSFIRFHVFVITLVLLPKWLYVGYEALFGTRNCHVYFVVSITCFLTSRKRLWLIIIFECFRWNYTVLHFYA